MVASKNTQEDIAAFLASQPEPKGSDLRHVHERILAEYPDALLWFDDGRDDSGRVVTNPSIGYGTRTMHYADGSTRETFRIGLSANTTGISVYVMGLEDKTHLQRTYGAAIGKATVTGYCIRFRRLAVIEPQVLFRAIADGMEDVLA